MNQRARIEKLLAEAKTALGIEDTATPPEECRECDVAGGHARDCPIAIGMREDDAYDSWRATHEEVLP